jgi:1-pyrroline-5-carboxylate dehydrogenase
LITPKADQLDLLGEAVTDLSGASQATQQYLKAVETIADRGIDSTVSLKLTQLGLLIVGQQPFGGAGASGTNDKAGSVLNLLRWVSPRTIKETFVPATDYRYPFMR